jgi:hypothetical protein
MSRRIEVELTSARPDGSWTWRAAGAREPKGVVEGSVLPGEARVGDVLRVEVDVHVDGIEILSVLPSKSARREPERLQLVTSDRPFEPVVQTLAPGGRGDRPRRDRERSERRDRPAGERPRRDGDRPRRDGDRPGGERRDGAPRGDRPGGDRLRRDRPERSDRPDRPRGDRPFRAPVPELPQRPKPKRLRAGRAHAAAVLAALPEEQRPIAEQVLKGGMPAVRQALQEQNATRKAEGQAELPVAGVLKLAEELLPKVRVADWLDRAEAALADLSELDLRDLRSVVAAANDPVVARDESTRALADQLKDGLASRQDQEQREWLEDIDLALNVGRVVRALRLSSRPPKAGVLFPPEMAVRLIEATQAALTPDATAERWATVIEALSFSPMRAQVAVSAPPTQITDELRQVVVRFAGVVPAIAAVFGIDPPPAGTRPPRPARPARRPDSAARGPKRREQATSAEAEASVEPSSVEPAPGTAPDAAEGPTESAAAES